MLGVEGDRLTVDGRPAFLVFLSYFDALRRVRGGGVDEDFRYLAGKVDGVRVMPNWWIYGCGRLRSGGDTLIDLDGNLRPAAWRDLDRLLEAAAAHGLLVDLTLTRETVTDNGSPPRVLPPDAYARALATLVGSRDYLKGKHPHVLVDVQNEWEQVDDAPAIEALLGRLREADPSRVLAASSSGDAYRPVGRTLPNVVAAYHDPRGRDWFRSATVGRVVSGVRAVLRDARQPVYLQEPMPWGALCEGQASDDDPSRFAAAVASARSSGAAAWTFHTRLTFDLRTRALTAKLGDPEHAAQKAAIDRLAAGDAPGPSGR